MSQDKYKKALEFYANRNHWMQLTESSEHSLLFCAGKQGCNDGWDVAEQALRDD